MPVQSTIRTDGGLAVTVPANEGGLEGDLSLPKNTESVILFAHGSGSSRHSPRNQFVARYLNGLGFGTLLIDLLTKHEEAVDEVTRELRFDITLLSERLVKATDWIFSNLNMNNIKIGLFGASTGAAAALVAAAARPNLVGAVVSRGGRPDLAGRALPAVHAPTLLIVGSNDFGVIELNEGALEKIRAPKKLELVPGATHLFEERGALEKAAGLAGDWFRSYLISQSHGTHIERRA
jgi:putative phosphoribosyl transferase